MSQITREVLHFNDEMSWLTARASDITSTESASLFGYGRETLFELACRKDGKTESRFRPNERTEIGREIEHAIAIRAARLFGVRIRRKSEYIRVAEWRMGASFDYEINGVDDNVVDDNRLRVAFGRHGPGLMEIKNVDARIFRDEWSLTGEAEAPLHIEVQLQHQLEVGGMHWGCIVAFVGGNKIEIILRHRDGEVGEEIRRRVKGLWSDLAQGIYPPVMLPEDLTVLKQLHGHAEPGVTQCYFGDDLPAEMRLALLDYMRASRDEKSAKDRKDTAHGRLLPYIGNAEKVITDIATISCGVVPATQMAYERKEYRNFRIYPKKGIEL